MSDRLTESLKDTDSPHVIRTMDELEALDPDTALTLYPWEGAAIWPASYLQRRFEDNGHIPDLPAAVIATGVQVRAARKALDEVRKAKETK